MLHWLLQVPCLLPQVLCASHLCACCTVSVAGLVAAAGVLQATNATYAPYLFQPDKLFGEYDIGDKSIQCGRKADAFKWW
jgi:hypothetical protein